MKRSESILDKTMEKMGWIRFRAFCSYAVCLALYSLYVPTSYAVSDSVADVIKNGVGAGSSSAIVPPGESSAAILFKLIVALLIIGVAAYLTIRFLSQRTQSQSTKFSKTLFVHGLATGRAVHVIQVGDTVLFLGVGENVTLLDSIRERESVERFLTSLNESQADSLSKPLFWKQKNNDTEDHFDEQLLAQIERLRSEQSGDASALSKPTSRGVTK